MAARVGPCSAQAAGVMKIVSFETAPPDRGTGSRARSRRARPQRHYQPQQQLVVPRFLPGVDIRRSNSPSAASSRMLGVGCAAPEVGEHLCEGLPRVGGDPCLRIPMQDLVRVLHTRTTNRSADFDPSPAILFGPCTGAAPILPRHPDEVDVASPRRSQRDRLPLCLPAASRFTTIQQAGLRSRLSRV
jgi:hypothetical protein